MQQRAQPPRYEGRGYVRYEVAGFGPVPSSSVGNSEWPGYTGISLNGGYPQMDDFLQGTKWHRDIKMDED